MSEFAVGHAPVVGWVRELKLRMALNTKSTLILGGITKRKSFWLIAAVFFGLLGLADYHYSISNQIPSDGPLTIGFPMAFYWMLCPMITVGAGACQSGIRALGLIVDLVVCIAFAMLAASLLLRFARKNFLKRGLFWTITSAVFFLIFLLTSLVTALRSASHHGRGIEIGFPAVYLYEYAGDSLSALNLATDLVIWFVAAFICVAPFFRGTTTGSNDRLNSRQAGYYH